MSLTPEQNNDHKRHEDVYPKENPYANGHTTNFVDTQEIQEWDMYSDEAFEQVMAGSSKIDYVKSFISELLAKQAEDFELKISTIIEANLNHLIDIEKRHSAEIDKKKVKIDWNVLNDHIETGYGKCPCGNFVVLDGSYYCNQCGAEIIN